MQQTGCVSDLRKHRRVTIHRSARLSVADAWHDCILHDVSLGGAKLVVDAAIAVGTAVLLAEQDLGLIAATVQRIGEDGVSVAFGIDPASKSVLIDRLIGLLNA